MQLPWPCLALCVVLLTVQGIAHAAPAAQKKAKVSTLLPARKAGLWEVTVRSDDLVLQRQGQAKPRPQTVRMCTDAAAEPVMLFAIVPGQEDCREVSAKPRSAKTGGGWEIRSVCFVHDNRADAEMHLTGDLQSEYRGTYNVKYRLTPLHNTGRMLFEGRWLGGCQAGQRPGDMVLPNGITVNVVDDKKRAKDHAHEEHGHDHSGHKH